MDKKENRFHYAWVILFALCVIRSLSAAGINNTGGLFLKPVADELGIGIGNLSIYFSISSLATLIFMPFGGRLISKYSAKRSILLGILLQAGSFILLSFMSNVWAWYLLSIPMGIGGAILVNLIGPILINRWFIKNAGKALGILMAFAGLFGAVIQPIASNLIANYGWRNTYLWLGIIILVVVLITNFLFIKSHPIDKDTEALGIGEQSENTKQEIDGVGQARALKSASFYCLLIFMIAITAFGAFNQHLATFGTSLGYTSGNIGFVLSFSMIGSALGAILIGAVSDRLGVYKATMSVVIIVLISVMCLMTSSISFVLFAIGAFFLGLGAMGIPVLAPLLTKRFFGEKDYELIYAKVMMGAPLATILLLPLYGFIFDATGSYNFVFILLFIIILIGVFSIYTGKKKVDKA